MEQQCFPSSWEFCHQEEGLEDDEELKHALLCTSLELERTIITAREEISRREYQLIHLKDQLSKATKERAGAQAKCQMLMSEENPESFSETCSQTPLVQSMPQFAMNKPLPEKGKLLRAVIEAGPLLQNLLLAGPLPQWEHPPPRLDLTDIPLVSLSPPLIGLDQDSCMNPTATSDVCLNRKRPNLVLCEEESSDSTMNKHQKRVV